MAKIMTREYATPFSILHAVSLLSHKERISKFRDAINQIVNHDSVVVDLGTGSGVLAILAAKAGAKHVYAVDINADSLGYARIASRLNGVEDRIDFVKSHFMNYVPDERVDVVICEMLSSMMLVEQQIPASIHAKKMLLKKKGTLLPRQITIFLVPVECEAMRTRYEFLDLRFPPFPQTLANNEVRELANHHPIASFDFDSDRYSETISIEFQFDIQQDGVLSGFAGMFEAYLSQKIRLDMMDGWRDLFLPVDRSFNVKNGDILNMALEYNPGEFNSLSLHVDKL